MRLDSILLVLVGEEVADRFVHLEQIHQRLFLIDRLM